MKTIIIGLTGLLLPLLASGPAAAWAHANYHGGSTSHTPGSGSTTRVRATIARPVDRRGPVERDSRSEAIH